MVDIVIRTTKNVEKVAIYNRESFSDNFENYLKNLKTVLISCERSKFSFYQKSGKSKHFS